MTTADVIAVMNAGRIEQAGSPEDVYDRPRSEFVARFIGSSNVLKGQNRDGNGIAVAGVTLRLNGMKLPAHGETAISIRPHDIGIAASRPIAVQNVVPATVLR